MKILKLLSIAMFFFFLILILIAFIPEEKKSKIYASYDFISDETITELVPLNEIPMKTALLNSAVRVYFPDSGEIKVINIEEYICGVLTGEMYSTAPEEALKAVAVAARTYTQYMCFINSKKDYDIVADHSVSQAYISIDEAVKTWKNEGKDKYEIMKKAVEATVGEVLMFEGGLVCAFYHASSFPFTESCENVFVEKLPYLVGKQSTENEQNAYRSNKSLNLESLNGIFKANGYPELKLISKIENVLNENNRCKYLLVQSDEVSFIIDGREVRRLFGLNSTSFDVSFTKDVVEFVVYGFGHGVGLSQNGAEVMAKDGASYNEILNFYYPHTEICKTIYK